MAAGSGVAADCWWTWGSARKICWASMSESRRSMTPGGGTPAIGFRHLTGFSDWPRGTFDLVVQCTAFSSLPGSEIRRRTAALMEQSIGADGYILWWDLQRALAFAGGELLDPKTLFQRLQLITERQVSLLPDFCDSLRRLRGIGNGISWALSPIRPRPTHVIALMRPK